MTYTPFLREDGKYVTVDVEAGRGHCLTEKTPKFCPRELDFLPASGAVYLWDIMDVTSSFTGNHCLCVLSLSSAHLESKGVQ